MARDTWALLAVFATGFLALAGLTLGVYDRLDTRIDRLDDRIEGLNANLSGEIGKVQAGQAAIRERLVRLETLVGIADQDIQSGAGDESGRAS